MGKALIISEQGAGEYSIQPQIDTASVQARIDAINEKIRFYKGEGIYWGAVESLPVMAARVSEKKSAFDTAMEELNTAIQNLADGRANNIPLEDHTLEVKQAILDTQEAIASTTDEGLLALLQDQLSALNYELGCPSEESQLTLWLEVVAMDHSISDLQSTVSTAQSEADQAYADYVQAQADFDAGLITQEELDAAETAYNSAVSALQSAQYNLSQAQAQRASMISAIGCSPVADLEALQEEVEKKAKTADQAGNEYLREKAVYDIQALKITSLEKTIDQLNLSMSQAQAEQIAWCADYTEGLTGEVATIEVNGDDNQTIIRPGYDGNTTYNANRDGILQPTKLMTPAQAFSNYARMPGWQKWKPTYRIGTILAIAEDTCSVQLDEALSTRQAININQEEALENIEIDYMHCNGVVFQIGDRVVVEFSGMDWSNKKVIGFESNPKECPNRFFFIFETGGYTYQYRFNPITFEFESVAYFEKELGMTPQPGAYPYCCAQQYAKVQTSDLDVVQKYGNTDPWDVFYRVNCMSCDCIHNPGYAWSIISSPYQETVVIHLVNKYTMGHVAEFVLHGALNTLSWIRSGKITAIEEEPGSYLLERIITLNDEYAGIYQRYKINSITGDLSFLSYEDFEYDGTDADLQWIIQSYMGSDYRLFDILDVFGSGDWAPVGYSAILPAWSVGWSGSNPCTLEQFLSEHRDMSFFGLEGSYETLLTDQYVPRDPDHLVETGWDRYSSEYKGLIDYSNNITFANGGSLSCFSPLWPIPGYIEGGEIVDTVETYNEYPDQYSGEIPWSCPPPAAYSSELTAKTGTETSHSTIKLPFFGDIYLQNGTATYNGPVLPSGDPDVTYSSTNGSGWPFFSLAVGATVALLAVHWTENDPVNYPEKVQFFRKVISYGQDWSEAEWVEITDSITFPLSLSVGNFMGVFMY